MNYELDPLTDKMPLDKFHWSKEEKALIGEMSDFGPLSRGQWWLVDIYKGFDYKGIFIRSHMTDNVECFRFVCNIYNGTGEDKEICGWRFSPVNVNCKVKEVIIYND